MSGLNWSQYLAQYQFVNAFVKGPPGDGKTYLAAGASQIGKTLAIDVEGGLISARDVINPKNLTILLVKEQDPKAFFEKLSEAVGQALSGEYEWIILDSMSEVAGRMEDEYATASKDGRVDIKDWFVLTERVKRFGRLLRDLPCNKIVTAITKPTGKEDDGGKTIFEPVLPGQTAAVVPSFFDIVGLMRKRPVPKGPGTDYYLCTDGPSIFQVRDRTRMLAGEEKVDPKNPGNVWKKALEGIRRLSTPAAPAATAPVVAAAK
ncbi:MAG: AAA family ATPase [Vicinamibacteria bacterium]